MGIEGTGRPKVTRGARGNVVSLADLPPTSTIRWTPRRKEIVVDAVRGGLLTEKELLDRYLISAEEYRTWSKAHAEMAPLTKLRTTDLAMDNLKHEFVASGNLIVRPTYVIDADKMVLVHGTKLARLTQREVNLCKALFESPNFSIDLEALYVLLNMETLPTRRFMLYGVIADIRKKFIAVGVPPLNIVSRYKRVLLLNLSPR